MGMNGRAWRDEVDVEAGMVGRVETHCYEDSGYEISLSVFWLRVYAAVVKYHTISSETQP